MSEQWYPDEDPITGASLFMVIEHPIKGVVPTYGGPFDSYTLAERDEDESTKNEIHYIRERYDHDEGAWIENEIEGLRVVLVSEEKISTLKAQRDELQGFAEDIARNYDHDEDAHRYGTPCRVCRAEAVLKMVSAIANAEKMP